MLLSLIAAAWAEPIPVTALESVAKVAKVKVGVGGVFQAGGSMAHDTSVRLTPGPPSSGASTPFAGLSPGLGASFDVRFLDVVGLELDVLRSSDSGRATYTDEEGSVPFTARQAAWHVPLVLKLQAPSPVVRPNLQLGAQLVAPTQTLLNVRGDVPIEVGADASPYLVFLAGVGAEIKLPLPKRDIRIPISLRAGFENPYSRAATERTLMALDPDGQREPAALDSSWSYQGALTVGLTWYWPN